MLRKSIIMMALAATFTINVSAVQIEVPKWQPPVPGAEKCGKTQDCDRKGF